MAGIAVEEREHSFDPEKLAAARDRAGLTQRQAAQRLNMHFMSLSRIENGQQTTLDTLRRICELYGVTVKSILVSGSHLPEK